MIVEFAKYKLITEDPDFVEDPDNKTDGYSVYDEDARPFYCYVNKKHTKCEEVYFGDFAAYHENRDDEDSDESYPGRIWLRGKIISFWVYPNVELFKSIIQKIEKELGIKIFNNGWKIEVQMKNGKIKVRKFTSKHNDYYFADGEYQNVKLVPIEEYIGSEDVPDIQKKMHLMNWQEKQRMKEQGKLAPGFGSDIISWDSPRNLQYRQTIYQENKN